MNEDPLVTIDAYLNHVREHLHEEKADEIISELRGYMIEMAEALSNGPMTSTSAKKVVARFGAPSELAKEYVIDSSESDMEDYEQEFEEGLQEEEMEISPISYVATFFKFASITAFWLVICWLSVTPLGYWWFYSWTIVAPLLQFVFVATAFTALLLKSKNKQIQLRNVTFGTWSGIQKQATFPENLAMDIRGTKALVDIGFTISAIFGFVVYSRWGFSNFSMVYLGPTILFLIAHLVFAARRFGPAYPISFIKWEYAVNVMLLLLLNWVVTFGSYAWSYHSENMFIAWISIGYSSLILYQIVIRMQDLWRETIIRPSSYSERSAISPAAKQVLLNRTKSTALRTIGGMVATFLAILVTLPLTLLLAQHGISGSLWNTHGILIVLFASFAALVSVGCTSVYFVVRYYLVRSRGNSSVFGKRTRAEAALDLVVVGLGLILVLSSWSYWARALVNEVISLSSGFDLLHGSMLSTAIIAWGQFLIIAIVARIASDLGNLRKHDNIFATKAMVFSGNIFLVGTLFMTGIYIMLLAHLDSYPSILSQMFSILMLSYACLILVAFQKSTAGTKLKWREETQQVYQKTQ